MATKPATAAPRAPRPMTAAPAAKPADQLDDSNLVCPTDITPLADFMASNKITAIRQFLEEDPETGATVPYIRLGFSQPNGYPFVTFLTKNPDGSNKGNNVYFAKGDSQDIIASGADRIPAAGFATEYSVRLTFNKESGAPRIKLFGTGGGQYMDIETLLGL